MEERRDRGRGSRCGAAGQNKARRWGVGGGEESSARGFACAPRTERRARRGARGGCVGGGGLVRFVMCVLCVILLAQKSKKAHCAIVHAIDAETEHQQIFFKIQ